MAKRTVELGVGVFVILGIAALLMLAWQVSDISELTENDGYQVSAGFTNIGGLKPRAAVTVAGVRVGRVSAIDIDPQSFEAVVTMTLDPEYPLPVDTSASILTAGLLGEQYIGLEPGGAEDNLTAGSRIKLTQPALVLERLVGRLLTNIGE